MGLTRFVTVTVLATAIGVGSSENAHAKCGVPTVTVAPHDGSTLPPDPIVHVFVPRWADASTRLELRVNDTLVPVDIARVSETEAFVAWRIAFRAQPSDRVTIVQRDERRDDSSVLGTFTIDSEWVGPAQRAIEVLERETVRNRWSCSYTDAHFVTPTDAPAYHVAWTEGGEAKSAVFPHDLGDFFQWGDAEPSSGPGRLGLGHVSCFGATADASAVDPKSIVITGLWPDGNRAAPPAATPSTPQLDEPTDTDEPWLPLWPLLAGFAGLVLGARRVLLGSGRSRS